MMTLSIRLSISNVLIEISMCARVLVRVSLCIYVSNCVCIVLKKLAGLASSLEGMSGRHSVRKQRRIHLRISMPLQKNHLRRVDEHANTSVDCVVTVSLYSELVLRSSLYSLFLHACKRNARTFKGSRRAARAE